MATTDVLAGTPFSINTLPIKASPTPKPAPAPTTAPDLEAQELEAYKQKGQLAELEDEAVLRKEKETAEAQAKTTEDYAKAVTEDPTRKLLGEKVKERADTTFVPSKETAQDMGLLFTLTNIVGFMIGGKSKGNAQQAMSAMNGMLEGHQKGREDLYKKEKAIFEENSKALDKTIEALDRQFKEAMQLYAVDREAGMAKAQSAIAEHNATFLGDALKKNGLAYSADLLSKAVAQKDKKELASQRLQEKETEKRLQQARLNEEIRHHRELEAKQGKGATQQQAMAQRAVNALGGVASAVESLKELPAGTTTGLLPNLQTKDGMINYVRNAAGRKISNADSEMMNTLFTGIGRNLATIEGSGVATGLGELSKQMQSGVYINAGVDDPYKVAIKLADIRRIASENIQPAIDSGLMPEGQRATAEQLVKRIQDAIPFTTVDVVKAHNQGRKTIGEATQSVVQPGKKYATEAEAEAAFNAGTLKSGEKVNIGGKTGTWE